MPDSEPCQPAQSRAAVLIAAGRVQALLLLALVLVFPWGAIRAHLARGRSACHGHLPLTIPCQTSTNVEARHSNRLIPRALPAIPRTEFRQLSHAALPPRVQTRLVAPQLDSLLWRDEPTPEHPSQIAWAMPLPRAP